MVNHSGLNKFASATAPGYASVRNQIMNMLTIAQERHRVRFQARHIIPSRPVSTYTERKALQQELSAALAKQPTAIPFAHSVAVIGAGGMGKTQLVLSYVRDAAASYDAILWIDAHTRQSALASFRSCRDALGIPVPQGGSNVETLGDEAEVRAVLLWLAGRALPGEEWLMIIDSAEELQGEVGGIIPQGTMGKVIMTSRDASLVGLLSHQARSIRVDGMTVIEASYLLAKGLRCDMRPMDEQMQLLIEQIVSVLGMMPLAIDMVAAYLLQSGDQDFVSALQQYLSDYRHHRDQLLSNASYNAMSSREVSISTIWDTSFARLRAHSEHQGFASDDMMTFLTFFNHQSIQHDLFRHAALGLAELSHWLCTGDWALPSWLAALLTVTSERTWDSFHYRQTVNMLQRFCLIRPTQPPYPGVSMHDLIHWRASRARAGETSWHRYYVVFITAVCRSLGQLETADSVRLQTQLLAHLPTVQYVRKAVRGMRSDGKSFVYHAIGYVYELQGSLKQADAFYNHAVKSSAEALGVNDVETLTSISRLAAVCNKMGRYDRALKLQLQVVEALVVTVGERDPRTARARTTLATIYDSRESAEDSYVQHQAAFDAFLQIHGPDHPNTLVSMANLAICHCTLGHLATAEKMCLEVLTSRTARLGPSHPSTITSRADLCRIYGAQGRLEESRAMEEQALASSTKYLGHVHPTTLQIKMSLACTHRSLGDLDKAVELARSGYEDTVKALGTVHHQTDDAILTLGNTLLAAQRYGEGHEVFGRAVEMLKRHHGEEHGALRMAKEKLELCIRKGAAAQEGAERLEDSAL